MSALAVLAFGILLGYAVGSAHAWWSMSEPAPALEPRPGEVTITCGRPGCCERIVAPAYEGGADAAFLRALGWQQRFCGAWDCPEHAGALLRRGRP